MRKNNEFEVENKEIETLLKKMGRYIQKALIPTGWGFTLMIFDYSKNKEGSMFYLSSARREDMIKAMMEFIDKQQEGEIKN